MRYCLGPPDSFNNIWAALAFMPFGLFFDFMDGKVARWRHKSSLMGQELDSLADLVCSKLLLSPPTRLYPIPSLCVILCVYGQQAEPVGMLQISFGVSPAVCAFALGLRTPIDTLILSFFVLSGLTRLARFNVTVASLPKDATGKSKYFEGTPIPTTLTIALGMAWCVANGYILEKGVALGGGGKGGILDGGVTVFNGVPGGVVGLGMDGLLDVHPVVTIFAVWGCMMTSRSIKIPKI